MNNRSSTTNSFYKISCHLILFETSFNPCIYRTTVTAREGLNYHLKLIYSQVVFSLRIAKCVYLIERVEAEHGIRVLAVVRQCQLSLCQCQVEPGCHVAQLHLILPANHLSWINKTKILSRTTVAYINFRKYQCKKVQNHVVNYQFSASSLVYPKNNYRL